ncbi:nuclease [Elizabethkingia argentiflava]|uniref:Nuclease n=1 Tax=Elizabethkingia argenteiflava TaxID=2681556 RepID=A0A845PXS2_9FLAO|nr:thermonuclease family protein [Elizabethkingia argenteiflava]NAW51636.1 nuclease [Elizabethkingia argenteiflava]
MKKMLFLLGFPSMLVAQTLGTVVRVKDGDTVVVLLRGKTQKTLRLAEVDCPEKGQAFGKNAKNFTASQVFGKEVTYVQTEKDRYGRIVAKIYYDQGKYLSAELIRAGLGWWYSAYSTDLSLAALQWRAKKQKLGLWQDTNALAPWEYRKQKRNSSIKKSD